MGREVSVQVAFDESSGMGYKRSGQAKDGAAPVQITLVPRARVPAGRVRAEAGEPGKAKHVRVIQVGTTSDYVGRHQLVLTIPYSRKLPHAKTSSRRPQPADS